MGSNHLFSIVIHEIGQFSFWFWLILPVPVVAQAVLSLQQRLEFEQPEIDAIRRMDRAAFTIYLESLFANLGFVAEQTSTNEDQSTNFILRRNDLCLIVQTEGNSKDVGVAAVEKIVATRNMHQNAQAMLITNRGYTTKAQRIAMANNVVIWDRARLVESIHCIQNERQKRAR